MSMLIVKEKCEQLWSIKKLNNDIFGFQFQQGTKWKLGLLEKEINEYQSALEVTFSNAFRKYLQTMNGTDLPTINIHANDGRIPNYSVGFYSYPEDLKIIKQQFQKVKSKTIRNELKNDWLDIPSDVELIPIFGHRYVCCSKSMPNLEKVLSIYYDDICEMEDNIIDYIMKEVEEPW